MAFWKRGSDAQDSAVAQVRATAEEISTLRAARFAGTTEYSDRGPGTNHGVRSFLTDTAHQFLTVDGRTTEAIHLDRIVYLRLDEPTAAAVGKAWVARKAAAAQWELLVGLETVCAVAATADSATDLGPTPTDEGTLTRLRTAFLPDRSGREPQIKRLAQLVKVFQADAVTLDLFFDDAARLRRYRICWQEAKLSDPDVGDYRMTMAREYYDFAVDPEIKLPPARDVLMQGHLDADLRAVPVISVGAKE
ncbi:hypothetical protein GCM10009839_55180 [Catenulispora yoronensis]|uniref:Uncharacterized protein n=1 Tax=Catenulispora yoronensis TaxID=450799 RepID=A0ABN2UX23_9ACTN